MTPREITTRLRNDEHGWALMDALASAAIVVIAFASSMALFGSSERSAARDAKKSQALIVAQNEINRMRNVGQRDQGALEAMNGTTKVVVYRGASFNVAYTAIPTTGIGSGQQEACSVDYNATSENAAMPDESAFIYMRVDVGYMGAAGATGIAGGSTASTSSAGHATLDSHFAAERSAEENTSVGMLRVYTLDNAGAPQGVTGVTLYRTSDNSTINPAASNSTKGCFLFTNLAAGGYEIRVATTAQDIYMSNSSGTVKRNYTMPTGVLRSTAIKLAAPVKVVPTFKYTYGGANKTLTTSTAGVNGFVKNDSGTGNWVGMTDEVINPPTGNSSYFLTPGGVFMPNVSSSDSDKSKMYPTTNGYSGFPGPCRANDPGQANWINAPASLPNATWIPGGTLSPAPAFELSTLKPTATFPAAYGRGSDNQDAGYSWSDSYRWIIWGHALSSGQVQVALVGNATDGSNTPTTCNAGYSMNPAQAAAWRLLPGNFAGSGGVFSFGGSDVSTALPPGRYQVCVRVSYTYGRQQQKAAGKVFGNRTWKWNGSQESVSATGWMTSTLQVPYKTEQSVTEAFVGLPSWDHGGSADGSLTDGNTQCGDPSKWV